MVHGDTYLWLYEYDDNNRIKAPIKVSGWYRKDKDEYRIEIELSPNNDSTRKENKRIVFDVDAVDLFKFLKILKLKAL